ncbi:hypothetical protein [Tsukamurella ocularis]|uniref:hypothetical protein n=1 Tax=Tsukamurella ocularis TaxID=1970234 RepID=UPI0021677D91|nr:hypothetical protein [Tsukamurella ocularis]MCS3779408.1 hypothetical protein [Tsukamurella ocularis]MCS3789862.1 hypothetical protein [Tsukamurella ocularis]
MTHIVIDAIASPIVGRIRMQPSHWPSVLFSALGAALCGDDREGALAILDHMFESWRTEYGRRALREFEPPRPVLVDMRAVLPGGLGAARIRSQLPLWVRAVGLRFEAVMAGRQLCWVIDTEGAWWAMVEVSVRSSNGSAALDATIWARAEHVTVDTPENRRRLGFVDRPPYAVS